MPPSSDDLSGRAKPAARRAKNLGRKRGKQKGAAGNALPWVAVPDETVPHRPQGHCGCGADLAAARDVGIERSHQVHDLPEVHITVLQHEVYRVRGPSNTILTASSRYSGEYFLRLSGIDHPPFRTGPY
jgi:hypothetical protein